MERIIKGVTSAYRCDYQFEYEFCVPPLINNPQVNKSIVKAAKKTLGEGRVEILNSPAMSSPVLEKNLVFCITTISVLMMMLFHTALQY